MKSGFKSSKHILYQWKLKVDVISLVVKNVLDRRPIIQHKLFEKRPYTKAQKQQVHLSHYEINVDNKKIILHLMNCRQLGQGRKMYSKLIRSLLSGNP